MLPHDVHTRRVRVRVRRPYSSTEKYPRIRPLTGRYTNTGTWRLHLGVSHPLLGPLVRYMLGCGIHDCTQKSCQLHPWLHCQLMFVLPSLCLAFGVAVIESVFLLVISAHICQDTHLINLITHIRSDHSIIGSIVGTLFNPTPTGGQGWWRSGGVHPPRP